MDAGSSDTTSRGLVDVEDLGLKEDLSLKTYEPLELLDLDDDEDVDENIDEDIDEDGDDAAYPAAYPWESEGEDWDDRFDGEGIDGIDLNSGEFDEDLNDIVSEVNQTATDAANSASNIADDKVEFTKVTDDSILDKFAESAETGESFKLEDTIGEKDSSYSYDLDNPSFADLFKNSFGFGGK